MHDGDGKIAIVVYDSNAEPLNGPVNTGDHSDFPPFDGGPPVTDGRDPDNSDFGGGVAEQGDPIDMATGAFYFNVDIFNLPAVGMPISLSFQYNSRSGYDGPSGKSFQHGYDHRLYQGTNSVVFFGNQLIGERYNFDATQGRYICENPQGGYVVEVITTNGTEYQRNDLDGTVYSYNADGWLTRIQDRYGNKQDLYYQCAKLHSVVAENGRFVEFSYYDSGRISAVKDHTGRSWQFGYDLKGRLITMTRPDGASDTLVYNDTGIEELDDNVISWNEWGDSSYLTNVYDSEDRVVSQSIGGSTATLGYVDSATERATTYVDFQGSTQIWKFSLPELVLSSHTVLTEGHHQGEPVSYVSNFEYDTEGFVSKKVLSNGRTIEYTWDALGNPINELIRESELSLNYREVTRTFGGAYNQILSQTDQSGLTTNYTYDAIGNLTRIDYPALDLPTTQQVFETFDYNSQGQLIEHVDPEGHKTEFLFSTGGFGDGELSRVISHVDQTTTESVYYSYDNLAVESRRRTLMVSQCKASMMILTA